MLREQWSCYWWTFIFTGTISNAWTTERVLRNSRYYISCFWTVLSLFPKQKEWEREREVGGAATKASRGALSVTKQESLEITNATIVTYEQHIAWQEKPRGTQRASVLVDPSDPRCFVLVCQSRVGRGPLGSPDPKPRNMPTQCGMDISPEALPSQNSPVRCCTATPNFRRGTRYSSCRWTESAAFPPFCFSRWDVRESCGK